MSKTGNKPATTKLYRYGCLYTLWQGIGGWFFTVISACTFLGIPVVFAVGLINNDRINMPISDLLGFAFVWILSAPSTLFMLGFAHLFSPIRVSDQYLTVRFCFREFRVPWEHVLEIKTLGTIRRRGVLVRVSKSSLPWIYTLYGMAYWHPGGRYIPISFHVENYRELIREIRKKSPHLE